MKLSLSVRQVARCLEHNQNIVCSRARKQAKFSDPQAMLPHLLQPSMRAEGEEKFGTGGWAWLDSLLVVSS